MSKSEQFKTWFKAHMGHSPQLKLAYEALVELEESIAHSNTSAFGDGWYDGFLEAQKLAGEEHCYLEDMKADEILAKSEHAESEHEALKAKAA